MIEQKQQKNQLPKEIQTAFRELKILKHLKTAGFTKQFGFSYSYLFQIVFMLLFHHKNWFRLLESSKGEFFPGKDAIYRFLNHAAYPWRRFLTFLSAYVDAWMVRRPYVHSCGFFFAQFHQIENQRHN